MSRKSRKKRDRRAKWKKALDKPPGENENWICPMCGHTTPRRTFTPETLDIPTDKQVLSFVYTHIYGMTNKDAAKILRCSEAAVSQSLKRLRAKRPKISQFKKHPGDLGNLSQYLKPLHEVAQAKHRKRRK